MKQKEFSNKDLIFMLKKGDVSAFDSVYKEYRSVGSHKHVSVKLRPYSILISVITKFDYVIIVIVYILKHNH